MLRLCFYQSKIPGQLLISRSSQTSHHQGETILLVLGHSIGNCHDTIIQEPLCQSGYNIPCCKSFVWIKRTENCHAISKNGNNRQVRKLLWKIKYAAKKSEICTESLRIIFDPHDGDATQTHICSRKVLDLFASGKNLKIFLYINTRTVFFFQREHKRETKIIFKWME